MLHFSLVSVVTGNLAVCAAGAVPATLEDEAVRAVLTAYMSSVSYPDPLPLDPRLFAEDVEGFWSDGKTYRGRDVFVAACKTAVAELKPDFVKFTAKPQDVKIRRSGDMAWIACRIELSGTLTQERGDFHRSIRSTFVLRKHNNRWQIVHEHSSRLPQDAN